MHAWRFFLLALGVALVGPACDGASARPVPCNDDADCASLERCARGVCGPRPVVVDEDAGSAVEAPIAWTCAPLRYDEATRGASASCDCACGAPDPDCALAAAPVVGCALDTGFACIDGACVDVRCGDGALDDGEACDDANAVSGDGCAACAVEPGYLCAGAPSSCVLACGDGALASFEACDDGALDDGDGCSSLCAVEEGFSCEGEPSRCAPVCGDGLTVEGEVCDSATSSVACSQFGPFVGGAIACTETCDIDGPASCAPPVTCGGGDGGSALGLVTSGEIAGTVDDWHVPPTAGCGSIPSGAEDTSIFWTAPEDGAYVFTTTGSTFDTVLMVLEGCTTAVLACHDDVDEDDKTSRVVLDLLAGERVLVVIDGWNANSVGSYELHVDALVE